MVAANAENFYNDITGRLSMAEERDMYPEIMVIPMREELTRGRYQGSAHRR